MCHADFFDEFQLEELGHGMSLANAEHVGDDVFTSVTQFPQMVHDLWWKEGEIKEGG